MKKLLYILPLLFFTQISFGQIKTIKVQGAGGVGLSGIYTKTQIDSIIATLQPARFGIEDNLGIQDRLININNFSLDIVAGTPDYSGITSEIYQTSNQAGLYSQTQDEIHSQILTSDAYSQIDAVDDLIGEKRLFKVFNNSINIQRIGIGQDATIHEVPVSVNGNFADSAGNITIAAGGGGTTSSGIDSTTTVKTIIGSDTANITWNWKGGVGTPTKDTIWTHSGGSGGSETWEQTLTNQGSTPFTIDNTVDFGGHSLQLNNMSSFLFDAPNIDGSEGYMQADSHSQGFGNNYSTVFATDSLVQISSGDGVTISRSINIELSPNQIYFFGGSPSAPYNVNIKMIIDSSDAPPNSGLWIDPITKIVHSGLNAGSSGSSGVTSIAKGYGLLADGTITSTGTITVDSAALSLKYLRLSDSTIANRITANTSSIASNSSSITTNTSNISSNTSAITLKKDISDSISNTGYATVYSRNKARDSVQTNINANTASLALKYDSTNFIIATTQASVLLTSSTGFANYNGGVLTYDGTNKRISVVCSSGFRGVTFGSALVIGHRYTVHINSNGSTAGYLQLYANGLSILLTRLGEGDSYYTFTATTATALNIVGINTGTFYINYARIQEVPINVEIATKGDAPTGVLNNIYNNVNIVIGNTGTYAYQNNLVASASQVVIGANATADGTQASSVVIGSNAHANSGTANGGMVVIGDSAVNVSTGGWRNTLVGGHARGGGVSATAIGYGAFANGAHTEVFGRGGYNDIGNSVLLYNGGAGIIYLDAVAAKHLNPAMPGGELVDLSTNLLAGTQITTLRAGVAGRDATLSPTLTNIPGGIAKIMGGQGTGTASGGNLRLGITKPGGSSNNTVNADFVAVDISGTDGSTKIMKLIPSIGTTASASTVTINSDTTAFYTITALATGLTIANPTGTPGGGQILRIRIKDNGTSQTIAFGSQFRAGDITLPTATTASKTMYLEFTANVTDTKWDLLRKVDNF